jgi:hypothetical protein
MILDRLDPTDADVARATGWRLLPEGACKQEVCVPLPAGARPAPGRVDVRVLAERLGMALVEDTAHGVWALGPESGGRALTSAVLPEIILPDRFGRPFPLGSLRGTKVFLCAWASW